MLLVKKTTNQPSPFCVWHSAPAVLRLSFQVSGLSSTFAPILLEIVQSNQPEGVHLLVKEVRFVSLASPRLQSGCGACYEFAWKSTGPVPEAASVCSRLTDTQDLPEPGPHLIYQKLFPLTLAEFYFPFSLLELVPQKAPSQPGPEICRGWRVTSCFPSLARIPCESESTAACLGIIRNCVEQLVAKLRWESQILRPVLREFWKGSCLFSAEGEVFFIQGGDFCSRKGKAVR